VIQAGRHTNVPDDIETNVPLRFGSFCSIASGLKVISGNHPAVDAPEAVSNFPFREWGWGEYPPSTEKGGVLVGSDVWIGEDVRLMDGSQIAHGATVAACSVVAGFVPAYTVVAGNPAKVKKARFTPAQIDKLLDMEWWEWSGEEIKRALPSMQDVNTFL